MSRRSRMSISGIYTLTNAVSGTVYVGQARNIRKRWEVHRSTLEHGKHRNGYLQRAWNKYGAAAFRFEVILDLSNTPKDDLGRRRATWKDPAVRARRRAGMRAAWVRRKAAAAQAELPALDRE